MDKLGYVIGTMVICSFTFMLGKYPHDLFYSYCIALILFFIAVRVVHFIHVEKHFLLIDYCYIANAVVLYSMSIGRHDDYVFKIAYLWSNGLLGVSAWLFNNSLVYHRIDLLCSIALHLFPCIMMYHFRWFTIFEDAKLPLEERRYLTPTVEDTWEMYMQNMVTYPFLAYLGWLAIYASVNFIFFPATIDRNNYHTLYTKYRDFEGVHKMEKRLNMKYNPPIFCFTHFLLFFICHFIALLNYHSFWINTFGVILCSFTTVWNGASHYIDFFSKHYDKGDRKSVV